MCRVSQPLLLDGGDPDEEDDVEAAPSRWADADGAELRDLDDGSSSDQEGGAGGDKGGRNVLLDSAPRGVLVERHRWERRGLGLGRVVDVGGVCVEDVRFYGSFGTGW